MAISSRMSRRDALKLGALGSAALLLPFERRALTGTSVTRLAASKLPKPFTLPFAVPPVLQPIKRDETTDYYQLWQQETSVQIIPGFQTRIYGYNGITPGPTVVAQRGRPVVMQQINALPAENTKFRYTPWTSTQLHGSASLPEYDGYASDVTQRARGRTTTTPTSRMRGRSGTTTTACITPRRTPTWASPRCTSCMTKPSRLSTCRVATTTSR